MGKTWRSIFSASNLIIAKGAPIFVVIFAAFAQVLAWIGAISLSTTQQVMIWLVVAGLLVLFSIADMACRASENVRMHEVSVVWAQGQPTPPELRGQPEETSPPISPDERRTLGPVPQSGNGKSGDGPRLTVTTAAVFPHGCFLAREPDSISEAQDCDESIETRPVVDRSTGKPVFSCRVLDMDPELEGQMQATVVKVVAERMPVLPPPANGSALTAIEFEGLTAASYTISQGRAVYTGLRATGIKPVPPRGPEQTAGNGQQVDA